MTFLAKVWPAHKTVTVSLAISVAEVVLVWGPVPFIPHNANYPKALEDLAVFAWILGGFGSLASAAMALIFDRPFYAPLLALVVAFAAWSISGLTMLV